MREALLIFAKDSRLLRIPILLTLIGLGLFVSLSLAMLPTAGLPFRDALALGLPGTFLVVRYLTPTLVAGWCYLIARVVLADALHGDQQFWLTRPYSRAALFGAKVLFVLTYVSAPLTATQVAILVLNGSSVVGHLPGLLWSHALVLALLLGPLFAVAAMANSMSRVVAVLVPLAVGLAVLLAEAPRLQAFDWVRLSALVLLVPFVAGLVIWVQFRYRRSRLSWAILAVGIVVAFGVSRSIGWELAFAVQQRVRNSGTPTLSGTLVRPSADPAQSRESSSAVFEAGIEGVRLPFWFTLEGLCSDSLIVCEASQISLTAGNGQALRDSVRPMSSGRMTAPSDGCLGAAIVPRHATALLTAPVTVDAELYVTVFGDPTTTEVPLPGRRAVPDLGDCSARARSIPLSRGNTQRVADLTCDSAFVAPKIAVSFNSTDTFWPSSRPGYSPWPADLRLQPIERISRSFRTEAASIFVETRKIAGHERVRIRAENVDLNVYRQIP